MVTDSDTEDDNDQKRASAVYIFAWRWSFTPTWGTLEAFKEEHGNLASSLSMLMGKKGGYLFQLECTPRDRQPDCKGDDHVDNWHYQGYLRVTDRKRPQHIGASMGKTFPGIWVAPGVNGALEILRSYCMKRDDTYRAGPWADKPIKPPKKVYKGEDLPKVLFPWQQQIVDGFSLTADDRTINWLFDPVGLIGKSKFCKWAMFHQKGFFMSVAKASDIANVIMERESGDDVYLIDIPRTTSKCIDSSEIYQTLEQVKNGMVFCGKYHGGALLFPSPHVWVFSNYRPNRTRMSADRFKVWRVTTDRRLIPDNGKDNDGDVDMAARIPVGGLPGAEDINGDSGPPGTPTALRSLTACY